jgi:hypothetical protein
MGITKRLGATMAVVLGAVLAATGCSAGNSGSGGDPSGRVTPGAPGGGAAVDTVVDVTEVEPNNGPDLAGAQDLGSVSASQTFVVKGAVSSGGFDGKTYSGDFDLFTFDAASAGALDVTVEGAGAADLDVGVYDARLTQLAGDGATTPRASVKVASASGKMVVAVYSKDLATSYTLTIAYTKAASSAGAGSGGTCPTTPLLAAAHTGGCRIDTTTPVCAVADLTNGRSFELAWTTNQTFCEGPHEVVVTGDPPSAANSVSWKITSSYSGNDASMTRNSGGFMLITAKDLASISSTTGTYYYGVADFHGSRSEGRAFQVVK